MISSPLKQLLTFTRPYKKQMFAATLCSALNKICDIVPEILIGLAIDVIVNQNHSIISTLGITNPYTQIYLVGGLTMAFWIGESVFEYLYLILWRKVGHAVQHDIRIKTYAHMQQLPMHYFENKTSGGLAAIMNDDINQLEQFLSEGANAIIQLVVNIIVMGTIFIYLSPVLAMATAVPIPFVLIIAYYFQAQLNKHYSKLRHVVSCIASKLSNSIGGIATVKSYNTQAYEIAQLEAESTAYEQASLKANRINAAYIPLVRMAIMVGFIGALIVGGIFALQGKLPINWYAALVFLTQRFLWPFTSITTITDMYQKAIASAKRVFGILDEQIPLTHHTQILNKGSVKGAVEFKNLSFKYPNGTPIFNDISFTIPAGKTVAFVGGTGSGKSTIIKLLLGLYNPTHGSITLDEKDLAQYHIDSVRNAIALVSQESYLVDGTAAQNIAYGTPSATREQIIAAARKAEADEFITQLPQGYDTHIQEQGKNLSGGQRQRISIARAILKDAPLLIFDEATSAVDNETEAAISHSLRVLSHQKTVIMIAHRLSTIEHADIIFVMQHGKIVESGTHQELKDKNGAYAQLLAA